MAALTDLAEPRYASYIDLCRRLRLVTHWRCGDFYGTTASHEIDDDFDPAAVTFACVDEAVSVVDPYRDSRSFWIPNLADWLGLMRIFEWIEDFGILFKQEKGLWTCWAKRKGVHHQYERSTPEEAAAELWIELSNTWPVGS